MRTIFEFLAESTNPKEVIDFVKKRKEGAIAIAERAEAKGGVSKLTAYHFRAKIPIYDEVLTKIQKGGKVEPYLRLKYKVILNKLHTLGMTQKSYQELTGQLEVLGELLIESK